MPAGSGSPCTNPSPFPFGLIIDVATSLVLISPFGRAYLSPIVQSDEAAMAAFCPSSIGIHVNPSI
jgi:hypothetical protein